jgi:CRISPR-associated protein Csc1
MIERTYEARLYAPLFYSSTEGRSIRTEPILSATALMHALGYRYFGLEKRYALTGDETTEPSYDHLRELPVFVSDMRPVTVDAGERTFRSTDYRSERHFTTNDPEVAKRVTGKKSVPEILERSGAAWQTIRNYQGLSPGSTFEFTVWSAEPLPERPSFRMGIKQTGEFRARETTLNGLVLNKYLLEGVYDFSDDRMSELLERSDSFRRGNDPRLQHFIGAEPAFVREQVIPEILPEVVG